MRASLPDSEVSTREPSHPQDKPLTSISLIKGDNLVSHGPSGLVLLNFSVRSRTGCGGKVQTPEGAISSAHTDP